MINSFTAADRKPLPKPGGIRIDLDLDDLTQMLCLPKFFEFILQSTTT